MRHPRPQRASAYIDTPVEGSPPPATGPGSKYRCMVCAAPGSTRDPQEDEVRLVTIRAPGDPLFGWRLCFSCLRTWDERREAVLATGRAPTT